MTGELERAIEVMQSLLLPLRRGEFSEKLGKVSVYAQSAAKSRDEKSLNNSIRFARLNLDAVLVQALEALVWRPKNPTKTDEQKKAVALQKTFDRLEDPSSAMLEHFRSSSDPLNKYLVAGPWGHEYLQKRKIDFEDYDLKLCEMLACQNMPAGRIVLSYTMLCRKIDEIEVQSFEALEKKKLQNSS